MMAGGCAARQEVWLRHGSCSFAPGVARKRAGESAERMRTEVCSVGSECSRKAARPRRFAERLALRSDMYRYGG